MLLLAVPFSSPTPTSRRRPRTSLAGLQPPAQSLLLGLSCRSQRGAGQLLVLSCSLSPRRASAAALLCGAPATRPAPCAWSL